MAAFSTAKRTSCSTESKSRTRSSFRCSTNFREPRPIESSSIIAIFRSSELGSIYERLLEYEPVRDDGNIDIRLNPFARKGSGSYYTPDELVGLIIDQTVGPLVHERREAFHAKAKALKSVRKPLAERMDELRR